MSCARVLCAIVVLSAAVVHAAKPATKTPPKDAPPDALSALLGAAVTAAEDERYCDALYLFEALHLRNPSPRALFNAAEVAYAAGDRVKALDLFRLTQQRYPTFDSRRASSCSRA
jgi:hypothetical protein